jgi:triosephosphate isomerase
MRSSARLVRTWRRPAACWRNRPSPWSGKDCSAEEQGPYTGGVSAGMLTDWDCEYVIAGHSERRVRHGETDQMVAAKAKAALAHRLIPIVCVGETLAEPEAGLTAEVVQRQLAVVLEALGTDVAGAVGAYEPVWAIGTGRTATSEQAQAVHAALRTQLSTVVQDARRLPLLYGASVTPGNAGALFAKADIDGALVGGACLKAPDFSAICEAASAIGATVHR